MPGRAPVLDYFSPAENRPAYTEISKGVRLNLKRPLCTHYPWWRIGELVKRHGHWYFKHRIITSDGGLPPMFEKTYKKR